MLTHVSSPDAYLSVFVQQYILPLTFTRARGRSELRSCVKVEVAVLGSPSLISLTVSVDVKQCFIISAAGNSGCKRSERFSSTCTIPYLDHSRTIHVRIQDKDRRRKEERKKKTKDKFLFIFTSDMLSEM